MSSRRHRGSRASPSRLLISGGYPMKTVKQLAPFVENRPGTLAAVCRALAERKINIYAISISDAVDHAVVRMVVSDPDRAIHLLGDHGMLVVERDVLMIEGR